MVAHPDLIQRPIVERGARVTYTDPWVPTVREGAHTLTSVTFAEALRTGFDCGVIITDHSAFDYAQLAALPLIVDTRNALKAYAGAQILRL